MLVQQLIPLNLYQLITGPRIWPLTTTFTGSIFSFTEWAGSFQQNTFNSWLIPHWSICWITRYIFGSMWKFMGHVPSNLTIWSASVTTYLQYNAVPHIHWDHSSSTEHSREVSPQIVLHLHSEKTWNVVLHTELRPGPIYKTSYSYSRDYSWHRWWAVKHISHLSLNHVMGQRAVTLGRKEREGVVMQR